MKKGLFILILCIISVLVGLCGYYRLRRSASGRKTSRNSFKNFGRHGMSAYVIQTKNNTYVKKFKNKKGYEAEKQSYLRLAKNKHFPSLLEFDDQNFKLILEDGGDSISAQTTVPHLNLQLEEIVQALGQNKIQHNDIILHNFILKDDVLKLIDFEYAEDLSTPKQWTSRLSHREAEPLRGWGIKGCKTIPTLPTTATNLNDFLLQNGCGGFLFSEIHVIVLWRTNRKKKNRTRNIISTYHSLKILLERDMLVRNLNIPSGGVDTTVRFTLFILKDQNPIYVTKQTYSAKQLVNKHMYNLKKNIRGNYRNYKICHGSFNTEEARDVLQELDLLYYWSKNRPVFNTLNDLFTRLNKANVQYVVERSFENKDFKKSLTKKGDIDIITDNYYKFKEVSGGVNTHKNRKERDNGNKIQNRVKINGKDTLIDIRYVGDRYYPTRWMKDILKNKIAETNKFGTFFVPSKLDQVWMLYYHINVHHPRRPVTRKHKHMAKISKLATELAINPNEKNFHQFMKNKKYKIEVPEDPDVLLNRRWID